MPKTQKCPNCGYQFEEGLEDKGLSYSEAMKQIEALLEGDQTVYPEILSRQYGRPRLEIANMITKIRGKRRDRILRPRRQGGFKFLTQIEEISNCRDKRRRNIWGQHKILAQDSKILVALLIKTSDAEKIEQARKIEDEYYILGDFMEEPARAKRLPNGLFQVIDGNGAKEEP